MQNLRAMPDVSAWWRKLIDDPEVPWQFRMAASENIANRALGRPPQTTDTTVNANINKRYAVSFVPSDLAPKGSYIEHEEE
jgi:hypothetical protein